MTRLLKLLAPPAALFLVVLAGLSLVNRTTAAPPAPAPAAAAGATAAATAARSPEQRLRALQLAVRRAPGDARALAALGHAYLQRARETFDPGLYARAEEALRRAERADPRSADAQVGLGTLALARHDFRGALRHGRRARALAPGSPAAYAVLGDAQVELGRYAAAARTLQRGIDLKPTLASYSRVSYFRELHGDVEGAVEAMRLAVAAGGPAPENVAYVQSLLGNLELLRGRLPAARRAYRTALATAPGHAAAEAGLARVDAARGATDAARRRLRRVVDRLPLPEHVVALAELELAAGDRARAREAIALVQAQQALLESARVDTDVEMALFEADHGDRGRAVALARRAWAAAPGVRAADAMGWALTRAGRPAAGLRWGRRALALGSRDPLFLYHAGMSASAAKRPAVARRLLRRALAGNQAFSPLHAPRARRALEELA